MIRLHVSAAIVAAAFGVSLLSACSSGQAAPPVAITTTSVLQTLTNEQTIGSTVPSTPADVNPYGLDIAKISSGTIMAGDLVVCDFNNPANIQGTGTAIVALHPVVGASPSLIANDNTLLGCNALAMSTNGSIWTAAFTANDNPVFTSGGTLLTTLGSGPWHGPFGETFVTPIGTANPTYYVSNAGDGSLVRVTVMPGPTYTFTVIATGFPINGGMPGSILGPSGLNYQSSTDTLYVVDGTNNALYSINNVSQVTTNGITVNGMSFSGAFASSAHVVFSGAPLNGPISSALLFNGNIVLGNTLDPAGKNLLVEISPSGQMLNVKNVDTGAAAALFGMVATGMSTASTKLYFNDDNDNTVKVLSQ
jgi:hypothetical protein